MSRSRLHGAPHSSARGLGGPEQNLALKRLRSLLDLDRVHRSLPIGCRGQAVAARGLESSVARELRDQDKIVA